jgi:hypothetical protein
VNLLALGYWLWALGAVGADTPIVLENEHVRVTRNAAPCASPLTSGCEQRVFVALSEVDVTLHWEVVEKGNRAPGDRRHFRRGSVFVLGPRDAYSPPERGEYLEVTVKPSRPPIKSPPVTIPPDKNAILFDRPDFFVFEEKLDAGDTRARHSHRERVVIVINKTRLQQWPDGAPEIFRDQVPDDVRFNPPVVHVVKTVGELPLRNIVIEFKR